jgi:hypothetical protein
VRSEDGGQVYAREVGMKKLQGFRRALPFLVAFAALCVLEPMVDASYDSYGYSRHTSGTSAAYALAGEFRAVIANLLWIKVEKYHHEFIRTNSDYRADKDILPLIKVITDLDPSFVEAYLLGGWMLSMGLHREQEGILYLKEGIQNNPDSMALSEVLGTVYARKLNQPRAALPYLRRAYQLSADDWDRKRMRRLMRSVREMDREGAPE